jgi:cytochrome c biogenesis protein CcdA
VGAKETLAYQCLQTLGLDLPVGFEQTGVRAKKRGDRAQESLQELAFRLLYISLYLIAVVSIVFVCVFLIGQLPKEALPLPEVWIKVIVGLGLSLTYLLLWVLEWWRVRAVMKQVSKHASFAVEEKGGEYRMPTRVAYPG